MNQLSALAEAGDLDGLKAYLAKTVSRIPELPEKMREKPKIFEKPVNLEENVYDYK